MLNGKIIGRILGVLLMLEGICMLTIIPVSLYYAENDLFPALISAAITLFTGLLLFLTCKDQNKTLGKREGFLIASSTWLVLSAFGSLPFIISGAIPSYTDAFFESVSGFTTTGASILTDVESLSHGLLYWRSLTQWLGGMGVIILSLAILPILKIGGMQLLSAEVPGPNTDKLRPRIKDTAKKLWTIYLLFTVSQTILLKLGGMSLFDAVCHSFTTMSTGGFSTRTAGIAAFDTPYIHYIIIIFMIIGGANFSLIYFGMRGRIKRVIENEEFSFYIAVLLLFTLAIGALLHFSSGHELEQSFRHAAFQVVSVVTTTGFASSDYTLWTPLLIIVLFILMFTGASAGSTGGGIKMIRLLLLVKNTRQELRRIIHPTAVVPVQFNHRLVSQDIIYNVLAFIIFYFLTTGVSAVVISALGYDIATSFSAVAATLGNIGTGLGKVGPSVNFAHFPVFGKWFFSFLMILGRLELFTLLVLFSGWFYRD